MKNFEITLESGEIREQEALNIADAITFSSINPKLITAVKLKPEITNATN